VGWNEYGVDERTHATVKVFGAGADNSNVKRETEDRQTEMGASEEMGMEERITRRHWKGTD